MINLRALIPSVFTGVFVYFFMKTTGYKSFFVRLYDVIEYIAVFSGVLFAALRWSRARVGQGLVHYLSRALSINLVSLAFVCAILALIRLLDLWSETQYESFSLILEAFLLYFVEGLGFIAQSTMFIGFVLTSLVAGVFALFQFRAYAD